jgi:Ca2+-binding EF-hand superfamily protein
MISNENSKVVTNKSTNPVKKKMSAIFSSLPAFFIVPFIDKNDRIQLVINKNMAAVVNSSMIVLPEMLSNLSEVSTTKHNPSKLEEAFKICGDLSLLSAM